MERVNIVVVCMLIVGLETVTVSSQSNDGVGLISESLSSPLPNNGILSAEQIGRNAGQGVECFSNDTITFGIGEWISPNGAVVPTGSSSNDVLYVLRGPGRVTLYRSRSLTMDFEGIYTCRITDTNSREHSLTVGIYTEENFENGIPVIPNPPLFSLLTSLSEFPPMFFLTCVSTSFPPTNVTWLLDGEPVFNDDDDFQTSQTLISTAATTFSNALMVFSNYSGEFTCQTANSRGIAQRSYNVTRPSGPPELLDQNVTFLGSGNVNISWPRPDGPVHGYLLFYSLSSDPGSEVVINITSPSTTHAVLLGLQAGASYDISVLAFADLPTERSDTLVLTLNVAGVPENITVTPASSTSLNVSWNHPGDNVVGYIVHYQPTGTGCPGIMGGEVTVSFPDSNFILPGLEEDTEYNITISTVSRAAEGEPSSPFVSRTLRDSPSLSPVNVTVNTTDPDTVFISWQPPPCLGQNGPITNYTLMYTDLFVNQLRTQPGIQNLNFTLTGGSIDAFRNISFQVAAVTSIGTGNFSEPVFGHLIGNPGSLRTLQVISQDITSVVLRWDPNVLIRQVFSNDFTYNVTWGTISDDLQQFKSIGSKLDIDSTRFEVPFLAPNTSYGFYVTAVSSFTSGLPTLETGRTTTLEVVTELSVVEASRSSVNITWIPLESNDIVFYEIYYNISGRSVNETVRANVTEETPLLVLSNLNNDHTYIFTIAAVVFGNGSEIRGPRSESVEFSFSSDSNLMLILIITFSCIGGIIFLIIVIVVTVFFLNVLSRNLGPQLANEDEADYLPLKLLGSQQEEDMVKATPTKGPPTVTGNLSGDIHSVEGQEVVIRFRVQGNPKPSLKWKLDDQDLDQESSSFIQRESTIVFRRVEVEHSGVYKLSAVNANGTAEARVRLIVYPDTEITRHPPENEAISTLSISLDKFGQYVASLHANGNKKFRDQFKLISSGEVAHPVKDVLADDNRLYNRFQHIVVYDDNRIKLEKIPRFLDCQHEYINACYIKGEGEKCHQFIATQGPLEHTVIDMWRLVWQEKAPAIVMLTKTREDLRIKCSQYWPIKGSGRYGPFTVTLLQETTRNGYIVRELAVHYNTLSNNVRSRLVSPTGKIDIQYKEPFSNSKSTLRVTQYQYTEWPEHGTVEHLPSLLELHDKIIKRFSLYPIVVHCSNGVGRTGAFIAMDMALEQSRKQGAIDVPAIVADIRNQRMKMIQTLDQYILVHDAVIEKIICGDNHIHVNTLHATVSSLEESDENTGQTGYQKQFDILEQVTVGPNNAVCSYAKQFPRKNREGFALPTNQWRVPLKGESPDYINATFVLGYNNPRSFIVTQGPLRETRRDFWKMIYDQEITTIVMLTSITEGEQEVCAQYWPSEGNIEFGEFVILVKDTWSHDGFTRRILMVKEQKTNSLRRVVQYQVNGWGSDGVSPCNVLGVVNAINLVATTQRKTPNIPVLVHCSDGVSRSAMFCISMASIERCKVEGVVDIFQLVKKMRSQLPGAICSTEQYKTVHNMVVAFLNVFSTAANFEHLEDKC